MRSWPERIAWCESCGEWWPFRLPFWHVIPYRAGEVVTPPGRNPYTRRTSGASATCVVHLGGAKKSVDGARAALVRGRHRCLTPGCPVVIPDGRRLCHGCRRTAELEAAA